MEPPYKPELSSDSDVSMFDPSFTGMKPIVSPGNSDDPVPADLFQVSSIGFSLELLHYQIFTLVIFDFY